MNRYFLFVLLATGGLMLAGCNSHDHHNNGGSSASTSTDYVGLVKKQVKTMPDEAQPVATNRLKFNNLGETNSNTFAGVDFGKVADPPGISLATTACNNNSNCKPGIH